MKRIHSVASESANPETLLLHRANQQMLRDALEALPVAFREVVVCASWRGCRTKRLPRLPSCLGTVMSRLARARTRLQEWLTTRLHTEV